MVVDCIGDRNPPIDGVITGATSELKSRSSNKSKLFFGSGLFDFFRVTFLDTGGMVVLSGSSSEDGAEYFSSLDVASLSDSLSLSDSSELPSSDEFDLNL